MVQKDEIQGSFAQNAHLFERLDTALEITNARHDNLEMRSHWYRTGDNPIYTRQRDSAILTFSNYPLILNNLEQAIPQLRGTRNYALSQEELRKALEQKIVTIDLSQVRFIAPKDQYDRFIVDTSDPSLSKLNPEEQKLVHVPFGEGDILAKNLKMLSDVGIKQTAIWTLTHEYVMDTIPENSSVARLCRLNSFDCGSYFGADGWDVGLEGSWLRGVRRREVAEGAQKSPQEILSTKQGFTLEQWLAYAKLNKRKIIDVMGKENNLDLIEILQGYATKQ